MGKVRLNFQSVDFSNKMKKINKSLEEKTPEQLCSEQQKYNSNKASMFKKWFFGLSIITMIASIITIPVIATDCPKYISILSAIIVALANGLNSIFKFHEKWLYHRNLAELFKADFHNYKWGIKDYKGLEADEKEELFKSNIRSIIDKGNLDWSNFELIDDKDKKDK